MGSARNVQLQKSEVADSAAARQSRLVVDFQNAGGHAGGRAATGLILKDTEFRRNDRPTSRDR